jgi:hypothetical protein
VCAGQGGGAVVEWWWWWSWIKVRVCAASRGGGGLHVQLQLLPGAAAAALITPVQDCRQQVVRMMTGCPKLHQQALQGGVGWVVAAAANSGVEWCERSGVEWCGRRGGSSSRHV